MFIKTQSWTQLKNSLRFLTSFYAILIHLHIYVLCVCITGSHTLLTYKQRLNKNKRQSLLLLHWIFPWDKSHRTWHWTWNLPFFIYSSRPLGPRDSPVCTSTPFLEAHNLTQCFSRWCWGRESELRPLNLHSKCTYLPHWLPSPALDTPAIIFRHPDYNCYYSPHLLIVIAQQSLKHSGFYVCHLVWSVW